jgi:hypothetical protein
MTTTKNVPSRQLQAATALSTLKKNCQVESCAIYNKNVSTCGSLVSFKWRVENSEFSNFSVFCSVHCDTIM